MGAMDLWIVEDGSGWDRSRRHLAQDLSICFEQSIHGLDHLSSHPPNDAHFSFFLSCEDISGAMGLDESLVELRPLTVLIAHHSSDNEKHHLTHRSATSTG